VHSESEGLVAKPELGQPSLYGEAAASGGWVGNQSPRNSVPVNWYGQSSIPSCVTSNLASLDGRLTPLAELPQGSPPVMNVPEVVGTLSGVPPDSDPSSPGRGNPASQESLSGHSCVSSVTPVMLPQGGIADGGNHPLCIRGHPRMLHGGSRTGNPLVVDSGNSSSLDSEKRATHLAQEPSGLRRSTNMPKTPVALTTTAHRTYDEAPRIADYEIDRHTTALRSALTMHARIDEATQKSWPPTPSTRTPSNLPKTSVALGTTTAHQTCDEETRTVDYEIDRCTTTMLAMHACIVDATKKPRPPMPSARTPSVQPEVHEVTEALVTSNATANQASTKQLSTMRSSGVVHRLQTLVWSTESRPYA